MYKKSGGTTTFPNKHMNTHKGSKRRCSPC